MYIKPLSNDPGALRLIHSPISHSFHFLFTRSFFCTACRAAALSSFCTHSLSLYLKNSHYVTDSHLFVNAFRPLTSSREKYIKVKSKKACSKEQKENIFIHRHSLSLSPSHNHTHGHIHCYIVQACESYHVVLPMRVLQTL